MDRLALVLLIIGGINWGLVGLLRFDLVVWIFGTSSMVTRTIYTIIGAAGIYSIINFFMISSIS